MSADARASRALLSTIAGSYSSQAPTTAARGEGVAGRSIITRILITSESIVLRGALQ